MIPSLESWCHHRSITVSIVIASLHCIVLYGDGEVAGFPRFELMEAPERRPPPFV